MAAKHASNQRQTTSGRKSAAQPTRGTAPSTARASDEQGAIGHMRDEVSDYLSRGTSQVRDLTRDHEGTTVLLALAAGFGVGVLIGAALAASSEPRPRSWTDRIAAEGIGRRLLERVESIIPEALAERIGR
jgi:hypothetical protein